jgi:urease accessory protein
MLTITQTAITTSHPGAPLRVEAAPVVIRRGQHGVLRLRFARRGGKTALTGRYSRAPFGAVRANYPDGTGAPEVQITNPSGGTLGGDRLEVEVVLEPGSAATVLTQAANKAYRGEESSQRAVLSVGDGAFLEYLPHHLIPFPASSCSQETAFHLAESATLVTWDAYAAGRIARGERFAFDALRAMTRIRRNGSPEATDGFDLLGGRERFGGYSYVASAYVSAPQDLAPLAEELHGYLYRLPGTLASASAPTSGLCAVRIMATGAGALYGALNGFRGVSRRFLGQPEPAREVW